MTDSEPAGGTGDPQAAVRAATTSLVYGFAFSQISGTVARLGIPEAFTAPVMSVGELAHATGSRPYALNRLLRAAATLGMFTVGEDGRFALTPLGTAFRESPALRALAALYGDRSVWAAYGSLADAVRDGGTAFDLANGAPLYEALQHDERLAEHFHTAMGLVTAAQTPPLVEHYDFGRFGHVVDVGGGDGTLLAAVLAAHGHLRGTLAETAATLRTAGPVLAGAGVADRCATVGVDFLDHVPPGGDAYVLKNVLHNFDDADCVRVLGNCRAAAAPAGVVLVPTLVLPERHTVEDREQAALMALSDVEMMVLTPGRERTLAEHEELFGKAGLELADVVPLPGLPGHFVLETRPSGTPRPARHGPTP